MITRAEPDPGGLPAVLVVEGCRLAGAGLVALISSRPWSGPVHGVRAFDPADPHPSDLVIVDARDPGAAALPALVSRSLPAAHLVVLAVGPDEAGIVGWAERGVAGILTADDGIAELDAVGAIVGQGGTACSSTVASVLLRQFASRPEAARRGADVRLTPREREVLALIELGWSNKQIARHLCIEIRTVKNHVHHLLEKLRVSRRADAAIWRGREPELAGDGVLDPHHLVEPAPSW